MVRQVALPGAPLLGDTAPFAFLPVHAGRVGMCGNHQALHQAPTNLFDLGTAGLFRSEVGPSQCDVGFYNQGESPVHLRKSPNGHEPSTSTPQHAAALVHFHAIHRHCGRSKASTVPCPLTRAQLTSECCQSTWAGPGTNTPSAQGLPSLCIRPDLRMLSLL